MTTTRIWQTAEWKRNKKEWAKKPENQKCSLCPSTEDILPHHLKKSKTKEEYISLKGTIPICKSCHFKLEKLGLKICQKCKKNHHKTIYSYCKECDPQFKLCPKCGKNWYHVSYETCRDCNPYADLPFDEQMRREMEEMHEQDKELFKEWVCSDCKYAVIREMHEDDFDIFDTSRGAECKHPVAKLVGTPWEDVPDETERAKQECKYKEVRRCNLVK